ncbi:hypothetical protein Tco_0407534 [Tanacetum coccineum]
MAVNVDSWFEAMQDEIHEFDRLKVWELVPRPDYVMVIGLKWIYKVMLDEYGDVLKDKAWLVAKGYRQEEEYDHLPDGSLITAFLNGRPLSGLKHGTIRRGSHGVPVDQTRFRRNGGFPNGTFQPSRPDLVFAVCMCARYQAKPTKKHLEAIKRIFRYLKGTINMGLWYPKNNTMSLTAYADADHAGCQDSRRSTSGSAQSLGDSWLAGHQRSKEARPSQQQRQNTLHMLDAVIKIFDEISA